MKLKELNIVSYGKVNNRKIELKDNFNLIYGPNESGKSTIRSFIFNMFYGGTIPGSKRAIYSREYDKYLPWQNPKYEGGIVVEYQGENYYFYRNFLKSRENFSINNMDTGEDSKKIFNVDTSRKVEILEEEFFGIKESTLRDLFVVTDEFTMSENLTYDLKDRILNYFSTQSEVISLEDVFNNIQNYTNSKEDRRDIRDIKNELKLISDNYSEFENSKDYDNLLKSLEILDYEIETLQESLGEMEKEFQNNLNLSNSTPNSLMDREHSLEIIRIENKIESLERELHELVNKKNSRGKLIFSLAFVILMGIGIYLKRPLIIAIGFIGLLANFLFFQKEKLIKSKKMELGKLFTELDEMLKGRESFSSNLDSENLLKTSFQKMDVNREYLSEKKLERERTLEKLRQLDMKIASKKDLLLRRKELENNLEELTFRKDMGDLSVSILKDISKKSFQEVSKVLIEDSSYFVNKITKGKYSKLYISDSGDITLFDEELKQIVELENLSQGAMGQIYLAYRLGLIVNSGIKFPIFIDDGLTLYDDDREKASLELLKEISNEYQIIFFTNRRETLEMMSRKYNINVIKI